VAKQSAGILLYRVRDDTLEVLLAHPGGPFWAKKDRGAWSIPKGEFGEGEDPLAAARREFVEETGFEVAGAARSLGQITQTGGKMVFAWAVRGDGDPAGFRSNTFSMEWPPRSGRRIDVPEVDRVEWFPLDRAREKINASQAAFLDQLRRLVQEPLSTP
jgi:predicted NUDIX family NTP pyrophosphohydrolase